MVTEPPNPSIEPANDAGGEEETIRRRVVSRPASSVELRIPRWLWHLRMPTGALTLLAGREGIGKSTLAFDLAARITHGDLGGIHAGHPRSVGIVASEDSWESVILPRLLAAGADLNRAYQIEARTEVGLETIVTPRDIAELKEVCAELDVALIVIDPIMSVIPGGLDTHKDREVRQALEPLVRFAGASGVSVLGLIHVNKSGGADPLNTVMGSRAFTAVARSVLYAIEDSETEEGAEPRYILGHPKSNLGPKQPSIGYRISTHKIQLDETDTSGFDQTLLTSRITWLGEDTRSVADVLETPRDRAAGELAAAILDWVRAARGTVAAADLTKAFPETKRGTLDANLSRLVKRGRLVRPLHGHYALPTEDHQGSDTNSYTLSGDLICVRRRRSARSQDQTYGSDRTDILGGIENLPQEGAQEVTVYTQPVTDWGETESWGEPPGDYE